jgi:hypothetical protein
MLHKKRELTSPPAPLLGKERGVLVPRLGKERDVLAKAETG